MTNRDDFGINVYILDGHTPVKVRLEEWSRWFSTHTAERIVRQENTSFCRVSTVFLGNDMNWSGKGPPILFETMVFERQRKVSEGFDGKLFSFREGLDQWRYSSWDDAEAGHKSIVRRIKRQEKEAAQA